MLYCEETTAMSYRRWSKKLEVYGFRLRDDGDRVPMNAGHEHAERCAWLAWDSGLR